MPKKLTMQQRLIDTLVSTKRATFVEGRSTKYVTLKRTAGGFYFVGPAGALRYGRNVSASIPSPEGFKQRLLGTTTSPKE